jgi:hypothetical protein
MKLIAKNQLVGDGTGIAFFRDMYEKENGERVSVHITESFWMEDQRKLGEAYPSHEELIARFAIRANQ